MRRSDVLLSAALGAVLFAGSTWLAHAEEAAPAPEALAAAAATMSPRPGVAFAVSSASSVDAYKKQFAELISERGKDRLADTLPVILKGVIVLDVTIDHEGNVTELKLWRSNGYEDLEKTALESVRKVGRFPAPSDAGARRASNRCASSRRGSSATTGATACAAPSPRSGSRRCRSPERPGPRRSSVIGPSPGGVE